MHLFRKTMSLCFIVFVSNVAYAQLKIYKSDFVVTTKGDTLAGSVTLIGSSEGPAEIDFAASSQSSVRYKPADISAFFDMEEGLYMTAKVPVKTALTPPERSAFPDLVRVFLHCIIQSNSLSMYSYKTKEAGTHYYVQRNRDAPAELVIVKSTVNKDGTYFPIMENRFKAVLKSYLQDCDWINLQIDRTSLTQRSLQKLTEKYLECRQATPTFTGIADDGEWTFGAMAGLVSSSIKYTAELQPGYSNFGTKAGTNMMLGVYGDFLLSTKSRRLSLLNELIYRKAENIITSNYGDAKNSSKYDLNYLRLNVQMRYFFKDKGFQPFLMVGISGGVSVSSKGTMTSVSPTVGTTITPLQVQNFEEGFIAGGGVKYKKFDLLIKYEATTGFIANVDEKATMKNVYFGLAYRLW